MKEKPYDHSQTSTEKYIKFQKGCIISRMQPQLQSGVTTDELWGEVSPYTA